MSSITETNLKQDLMLYQENEGEVHILNPTAKRVYQLASEGKSVEEILDIFLQEFSGIDTATAQKDIEICLKDLRGKKLL